MSQKLLNILIDHVPYIISGLLYSVIEYRIGKSKDIKANSFLEVIELKFFGKK